MHNLYPFIKFVHVSAVLASGSFFILRGLLMMNESSLLNSRLVRVLPHVIDTVLLLAAITLVTLLGVLPVWVQVKIVALFVYIALGMVSFHFAKSYGLKLLSFFMALAVFAFIMSVAITKSPYGFLTPFF